MRPVPGGAEPSFLLHPLDFLGGDEVPGLSFFPGMDLSTDFKLSFFDQVVGRLAADFRIVTMLEHARRVAKGSDARTRDPEALRAVR